MVLLILVLYGELVKVVAVPFGYEDILYYRNQLIVDEDQREKINCKEFELFAGAKLCNSLLELDYKSPADSLGNEAQTGDNICINVTIVIHGVADQNSKD
jgi:hypothetical protein